MCTCTNSSLLTTTLLAYPEGGRSSMQNLRWSLRFCILCIKNLPPFLFSTWCILFASKMHSKTLSGKLYPPRGKCSAVHRKCKAFLLVHLLLLTTDSLYLVHFRSSALLTTFGVNQRGLEVRSTAITPLPTLFFSIA